MVLINIASATLALMAATAKAARFCDGNVCYSEVVSLSGVVYRVAIPDDAAQGRPFDVLLQIVAPRSVGWAGMAWGGGMVNNPLTVAYSDGGSSATVGSRWSTSQRLGVQPYAGATYTKLATSTTNATHWRLDAVCSGCSAWQGGGLNPADAAARVGYASGRSPPATPSSDTSAFMIHDTNGAMALDLAGAKIANFGDVVAAKKGGGGM